MASALLIILWCANIVGYAVGFMAPNAVSSIIMSIILLYYAFKGVGE